MKNNETRWHHHLEKQRKSSLTVQAYCDRHQLSTGMFYYWKRKLQASAVSASFTELRIADSEPFRAAIHVRFPSGVELWLDHDTDPSFLRAIAGC